MDVCPIVDFTLKVNGKDRVFRLQLNFAALALAEQMTGLNYLDPQQWSPLNITSMTAVFWAAAQQTDSDLQLLDIRKLGMKHAPAMLAACRKAWLQSNEAAEEPPNPIAGLEK